jgi:hypothetical protein
VFGICELGFRAKDVRSKMQGLWFSDFNLGCSVSGLGFRVKGLRFGI